MHGWAIFSVRWSDLEDTECGETMYYDDLFRIDYREDVELWDDLKLFPFGFLSSESQTISRRPGDKDEMDEMDEMDHLPGTG